MNLHLHPSAATKYDDPSLVCADGDGLPAKPLHKSSVALCADCLAEVATFLYSHLQKRLTKKVLESSPIDFWLTVPAVWSDLAKYDTLHAAKLARQLAKVMLHPDSQFYLILEPEAAAIATMSYLTMNDSQLQI